MGKNKRTNVFLLPGFGDNIETKSIIIDKNYNKHIKREAH